MSDRPRGVSRESLAYYNIPEHMHDGILLWFKHGIPPGGFLTAVIDNNLHDACSRADDINRHRLFDYVNWFYNCAPQGSWGFEGAMQGWCERFDVDNQ